MLTSVDGFLGLLADVSIKAGLLAGVAGTALVVFRVRNSNLRHRVWTAVLVAMLLLPLLTEFAPSVRIPAGSYPEFRATVDSSTTTVALMESSPPFPAAPLVGADQAGQPSQIVESSIRDAEFDAAPATAVPVSAAMRYWPLMLLCVYLAGVACFTARLLIAVRRARKLVHNARPITLTAVHTRLTGTTAVLESPQVRVPLTVGWRRPAILLPRDWSSWDESLLAAVLSHEQEHVRRGDYWVALLAEWNRALYWFHPVAWFVRRRLATLAEQACDDAVISSLGDRSGYARHLLAVAGRLTREPRRLRPAGVAMARTPQVEHRINAILDARRPLARRLGVAGALALVAIAVPLVLLAAGLKADNAIPKANRSLLLTVLDDKDVPVPGANVTVRIRQEFAGTWNVTRTRCDENGEVRVDVPEPTPHYLALRIELPGYAPFWAEWEQRETPDPIPNSYTTRLDPGRLIGGIVQNEDGEPIQGAKVSPRFNLKLREERTYPLGSGVDITTDAHGRWSYPSLPAHLQQLEVSLQHPEYWAARITESISKFAVASGATPSSVLVMKRGIAVAGRVTDENGRPIAGATVTYYNRNAYSSGDMPQVVTDHEGVYRLANGQAGDTFFTALAAGWAPSIKNVQIEPDVGPVDFQLTRGQPLRVRVVDSDKAPISGALVSLWSWEENDIFGSLSGSRGQTDTKGVWEWPHAPAGSIRFAIAKPGFTYIAERELTPGEKENVVTMTPESPEETRVLKVSGRVIDAETKEPIARFLVTPGDQREGRDTTYWYHEYQSEGRDGQFRKEFTPNLSTSTRHAIRVEADGYMPATSRVIRRDEGEIKVDFALQPGTGSDFLVLTPEGSAAKDATAAICTPTVGPTIEDGVVASYSTCERTTTSAEGRFSIAPQDGVFAMMVVHESGAVYVTQEKLSELKTIHLEPWARIEGTLRIRGKPAANEPVTLQRDEPRQPNFPKVHYSYRTTTDSEGKFVFERVIPGGGRVSRNVVSNIGNGMSTWTPTHSVESQFPAGETTRVDLSREGLPVVGRFVLPKDLEKDNDWRLAMVSLQPRPLIAASPPRVPFPKDIDPAKDREAAMEWWQEWKDTEEGKRFQEQIKRYQEAVRALTPVSYGAKVEPDGSFGFDDIPAGDYQLTAQALSRPANGPIGPGKVIASLTHTFTVPKMPGERSDEALDLGELKLEKTPPRNASK